MNRPSLIIKDNNTYHLQFFNLNTPFLIVLETSSDQANFYSVHRIGVNEHQQYKLTTHELEKNRPQHQHSCIEIMYVLSGHVINHVEKNDFIYSAGQCCIMNKNIQHCEEDKGEFQAVFFMLDDSFIEELIEDRKRENNIRALHIRQNSIYHFLEYSKNNNPKYEKTYLDLLPVIPENEILDQINPLFNSIVDQIVNKNAGSYLILKEVFSRFLELLSSPALYSLKQVKSDADHQYYLCDKISQIIEARHGRCSRKVLEDQLHYNGEYLNRIFKKHTGKTISEYCQSIFLSEAADLLIHTDESISSIIAKCGFSNRNHFYHLFKKQYGEQPKEYRKRHNT